MEILDLRGGASLDLMENDLCRRPLGIAIYEMYQLMISWFQRRSLFLRCFNDFLPSQWKLLILEAEPV